MFLALSFGEADVDRFLQTITAEQFVEWAHYYQLEPWGEVRDEIRNGSLCALVNNLLSKRKRKVKDFVFDNTKKEKKPQQSADEIKYSMMAWAASFGGLTNGSS
jgi:hypothetical protein